MAAADKKGTTFNNDGDPSDEDKDKDLNRQRT
jgi:hypothetical protein